MQTRLPRRYLIWSAIVLGLFLAVWFLFRPNLGHSGPDASSHRRGGADTSSRPIQASQPSLGRDRDTGEIIWRVGKPKPTLPVVRGANMQRQYGTPLNRQLPVDIEHSTPSVMAMTPADGRTHLLPEETDVYTLRSRRMVLDVEALDRVVVGATNHILAPTPGTEVLDLKIDSILTRTKQTHSLIGKIAGEALSDVLLVYHDGIIYGTVARYEKNQFIEYRILADGHMMVREIDASAVPEGCVNPGPPLIDTNHACNPNCRHENAEVVEPAPVTPTSETVPSIDGDTVGWTTIDVVVGYDIQARSAEGGVSQMEARIINSVDQMSNAFTNSLVTNTEVMLLGTIEDPNYIFPGDVSTDMGSTDELGDLENTASTNPELNTVSNYAALLGADLTSFICKDSQGTTAGIAYRPGRSSIVSRTSLFPSITFAHELGHNLGCQHSLGDSTNDSVLNTARYGLRFKGTSGSRFRTIMAYDSGTYSSTRIPYYANPNVNYDGTPTGINDGVDLTSNTFVDPAYATLGFNGSNPSLGARNAQMLMVASGNNGVVYASNRSIRSALAVTSPMASPSWAAGSTQTITFTGGDMDYTADIDLYKSGVYQYTIANNIDAIDHSYAWNIPLAQEGGNDFKIRVTLTHTTTSATSYAESGFFIIQGTSDIILESPVGGEIWTRSTKKHITWSSSYSGNVKIEYLKGAAAPVTIINSTPDDGSYEWTIPFDFVLGNDYKIKITSDISPYDSSTSATTFTVVAPNNNLLVTNLDTDPGFTMSGEFQYGAPQAGNGAASPKTGTNMYDTNLAATSFGASSLTTYAIDCSNHTNIILDFWAYIMVWTDYSVKWEISTDNTNWTTLANVGVGVTLNQPWTRYTYDITSIAAGISTVYIRWSMDGSGTQMSGGGLSIDDISITGNFIPADGIAVISPNGGESVTPLYLQEITWLSGLGGNVKIELLKNNSLHSTIKSSTANDGLYYWTPSDTLTLSNDYKIRVTSIEQSTRVDESDANFTLGINPLSAAVDAPQLKFNLTGNANWFAQAATIYYGVDAAQSGAITHNQSSSMALTFRTSGTLEFWWKVSSEQDFDFLRFYLNNVEQPGITAISGNTAWTRQTIAIPAGTNTVRWTYSKDGSVSVNPDAAWVDKIVFTPDIETFAAWGSGADFSDDANVDGISNGLAWLLGAGDPMSSMTANRPVVTTSSSNLVMTFSCLNAANRGAAKIYVEHSSDLGISDPWSTGSVIVPESSGSVGGVNFNITPNGAMNHVQATIPSGQASSGRLFGRVRASGP